MRLLFHKKYWEVSLYADPIVEVSFFGTAVAVKGTNRAIRIIMSSRSSQRSKLHVREGQEDGGDIELHLVFLGNWRWRR